MKINYGKICDELLSKLKETGERPKLLLHCCCAPCSSYVLEYLDGYFDITAFYYNPNISPACEYEKRAGELERLLREKQFKYPVNLIIAEYRGNDYYDAITGLENEPEGGSRCAVCFRVRLEKTAKLAKKLGFNYFATTLTVSPHKNEQVLNAVGLDLSEKYDIEYLPSDFKKHDGYKRSIELSAQYGLYRQNWCGCEFSKR